MLVQRDRRGQSVVTACEKARAHGVRPGMTLAEARALCPNLIHADHEPAKDAAALRALAAWMNRYSPLVAPASPDAILLDLTGTQRLYGDWSRLLQMISTSLSRLRLSHRLAIAPTPAAAWAIASFGPENAIVDADHLRQSLRPLPIAALRLEIEAAGALFQLGIETIGQLMGLPRAALPARFGPSVLNRLDSATGELIEVLDSVRPAATIRARMDFDAAVESMEAVWETFKRLIAQLTDQLRRQNRGARQMLAEFFPPRGKPIRKTIFLARPNRNPAALFDLLRCACENVRHDDGWIGIALSVPLAEPLADEQLGLLKEESRRGELEFYGLIERLTARLGPGVALTPRLIESHLPEKVCCFCEAAAHSAIPCPQSSIEKSRPIELLGEPVEIPCMVAPEGLPVAFTHEDRVFQISVASGPERISPPWWEGRNKTRDYFEVQESAGRRFWIFRVAETRKWYLHGFFV